MRGDLANGAAIRRLRSAAGLTQKGLAVLASCDEKTIRKAEQARRLDIASLQKIAIALRVDYELVVQDRTHVLPCRSNLQTVQQWHAALISRNVRQMVAPFCDDCVLHVPGLPDIPFAGTFHGKNELRRQTEIWLSTFKTIEIHKSGFRLDAVNEFVFLRGRLVMQRQVRQRRSDCYAAHEFRFQHGQISEAIVAYDTLATYRLLRSEKQSRTKTD